MIRDGYKVASQADVWYNGATIKYVAQAILQVSLSVTVQHRVKGRLYRMDSISLWNKTCLRCGENKPLDRFEKGRNVCRVCRKLPAPPKTALIDAHQCAYCRKIKPLEDFAPGTIKPYGVSSYCKECHKERYPGKPVEIPLKECSKCLKALPYSKFRKDSTVSDGHRSACRECDDAMIRANYVPCPRKQHVYEIPDVKQCKKCLEIKPIDNFSPSRSARDKHRSWCKPCSAQYTREKQTYQPLQYQEQHLRRKYGLTLEQYSAMLEAQGGVCAVCKRGQSTIDNRTGKPRALAVDHDHTTGQVRGLLCDGCNKALGCMGDNPELIRSLLEYAIKWRGGDSFAPFT